MSFPDLFFYFISILVIASALISVLSLNPKKTFIASTISITLVTIIFFLLNADYIALLHLLIFSFGTSIVILFVLINSGKHREKSKLGGSVLSLMIISIFAALFTGTLVTTKWKEISAYNGSLNAFDILKIIQAEYTLPLIVLSLIIFLAIIGTKFLTGREENG